MGIGRRGAAPALGHPCAGVTTGTRHGLMSLYKIYLLCSQSEVCLKAGCPCLHSQPVGRNKSSLRFQEMSWLVSYKGLFSLSDHDLLLHVVRQPHPKICRNLVSVSGFSLLFEFLTLVLFHLADLLLLVVTAAKPLCI